MKTKNMILVSLVVVLIALVGCSDNQTMTGKGVAEQNTAVSVRLPIPVIEALAAPYFSAIENGYYAKEGLNVTINPGSPELNPVKMVATGADDFGILGGPDTLLVARSKGQPLVAVEVLDRNSDFPVILTLKSSGLTTLDNLKNKKIGFYYGHISTDVLHTLFNKYDITHEEVDVGMDYSQLIAGKIDAQWAFKTTAGLNLPEKGIQVNVISPADYGINTHGYTIFTTEDMIKNNPDIVQKFVTATSEGVKFALEHPSEAVDILAKYSNINKTLEYKRLLMYNEVTSNSKEYPIGYMDYSMFDETYNRLVGVGVITQPFNVSDAFTTRFITKN
jgi:ABC-type nitrate/sulfonate/bicarbonate transport system substrate-binding protein